MTEERKPIDTIRTKARLEQCAESIRERRYLTGPLARWLVEAFCEQLGWDVPPLTITQKRKDQEKARARRLPDQMD